MAPIDPSEQLGTPAENLLIALTMEREAVAARDRLTPRMHANRVLEQLLPLLDPGEVARARAGRMINDTSAWCACCGLNPVTPAAAGEDTCDACLGGV